MKKVYVYIYIHFYVIMIQMILEYFRYLYIYNIRTKQSWDFVLGISIIIQYVTVI